MKKSCPNCKGTGHIIVDTKTCPECDGTGYEETINIKNHFKGINKKAKKPAYKLKIDFGNEIGIKKTSAQITDYYTPDELIGKQLLAVVNFPPKQIADFISEVLILGTYSTGGVILITPDKKAQNGDKLG